MTDTMLFVYNADSGLFNTLSDSAHKIFSPETYGCNLCSITHSALGIKTEWKEFLNTLNTLLEFMHRDEFLEKYEIQVTLPAIFRKSEDELQLLISAEQINQCSALAELKELVTKAIKS